MFGVEFHGLLRRHVAWHGCIAKRLGLHDTFHVSGPSVFPSDQTTWRFVETR